MPHVSIYSDWRVAKQAAAALAQACGFVLLQQPNGKPRILVGSKHRDYPSWLAAWSFLYQVRRDQILAK